MSSFKYLEINISEDLTWTAHIQTQVKKARKRLSSATAEEIQGLTSNPENVLFRGHRTCIERASQCGMVTPQIRNAKLCREFCSVCYLKRCKSRAAKIIKNKNHPSLFILLPSGKRYLSMMAKTERFRRIVFSQAIRLLNSNSV